jgi:hypothetical protein
VTGGLTSAAMFAGSLPNAGDEVLQACDEALSGSPRVEPAQSPGMQASQPSPPPMPPPFKLSRSPSPRNRLDSQEVSQIASATWSAPLLSQASSTEPTRIVHQKPAVEVLSMKMQLTLLDCIIFLVWNWNSIAPHVKFSDDFHFQTTLMYIASLSSTGRAGYMAFRSYRGRGSVARLLVLFTGLLAIGGTGPPKALAHAHGVGHVWELELPGHPLAHLRPSSNWDSNVSASAY